MSKDADFSKSMKKFRDNLRYFIKHQTEKVAETTSTEVAKAFVRVAQDTLVERATPSPESKSLVNSLKSNISSYKNTVSVETDPEGLMLFLEYGTGLTGRNNNTAEGLNDASAVGWNYASRLNEGRYVRMKKTGNLGWIFERKDDHYVDSDDWIIPKTSKFQVSERERVRWYFRIGKDGKRHLVKSYTRKRRKPKYRNKNLVFTTGLKPTRYIFDTKQKIRSFIDLNRGADIKAFIEELQNLK